MAKGHRTRYKKERNAANKDTRAKAHARYIRLSDQKAKIVLDQIKGKGVEEAAAILRFSPRYAASVVLKTLNSAAANAQENLNLEVSKLYVQEAYANRGSSHFGRFRLNPRGRGRGDRIERKMCHISIILNEK